MVLCFDIILFQFYPKWIAPNVLTLAGFLLYVLMWLVLTCYDNDFNAADQTNYSVPRWAWLLAAWCMFWAHTLGIYHPSAVSIVRCVCMFFHNHVHVWMHPHPTHSD